VAALATPLDADRVRANLAQVREEVGPDVEILAATKYVALEDVGALAQAGVTLAGENRAQDLEAKATAHPELTWDFIGQLQSRKVKQILPHVRYVHSVASESALEQLGRHGTPQTRVLMTMPPAARRPDDSRRWFAALRELASARGLPELSMGTTQDYAVAAQEGATIVRIGSRLYA
jgi:uncharacterized pyridoxal phosphate-containing UPF0001 family protein